MTEEKVSVSFEEGCRLLDEAINRLLRLLPQINEAVSHVDGKKLIPFTRKEYIDVYSVLYQMCIQRENDNFSAQLYEKHAETFDDYLTKSVLPSLLNYRGDELLIAVVRKWKEHEIMVKWMRKFFMYLDKYYVKQNSVPTLADTGVGKFRGIVYSQLREHFVEAMLDMIERERNGELIDSTLFNDGINVFVSLSRTAGTLPGATQDISVRGTGTAYGARENPVWRDAVVDDIYTDHFEKPFLERTKQYFAKKAKVWLDTLSAAEFLRESDLAIQKEKDRALKYFQQAAKASWTRQNPEADENTEFDAGAVGTLPKVVKVLQTFVLYENEAELLSKEGSGLKYMLQQHKVDDLELLYELYYEIPGGLDPLAEEFKQHIIHEGRQIQGSTKRAEDVVKLVGSYLDVHERYDELVKKQFSQNTLLSKVMKEAFELFLNEVKGSSSTTFAELLATYIDQQLKSSKLNESTRDVNLEKAVVLFEYLQEKDRFAEIYRVQLSKRLLNSLSHKQEFETSMISKFKTSVGAGYTSRMEGMVKDLMTGKSSREEFLQFCVENDIGDKEYSSPGMVSIAGLVFGVDLLTTGWWPGTIRMDLQYPSEMKKCLDIYEKYYSDTKEHKVLKWVHSLGTCIVKARFGDRVLELTLTTLQAATLLLFNDRKPLHFKEIKKALGLEKVLCMKVLHSFYRMKLLVKTTTASKIDTENDEFYIDENVKVKKNKFKVPMPSLEDTHNPKKVTEDRKHTIEAAIVRIMKARKSLDHNALIAEVLQQLHCFRPTGKQIKQRIEALIDRDFLERDGDNSQLYKYVS